MDYRCGTGSVAKRAAAGLMTRTTLAAAVAIAATAVPSACARLRHTLEPAS